jgi:cobalamin biosynthesis Mg chelatase CobN
MSYVSYGSLGASASASICLGMGCPGKKKETPKKPAPPKLESQTCYSKEEHEVLVDKCRGLSGFGEFTSEYLKAITKSFACDEAAKPICGKTPPPKPGMRVALPEKPKAPPPKPKISSTRATTPPPKPKLSSTKSATSSMVTQPEVPMYVTTPEPPVYAEEGGVSKTAIIVGVVGVAAVTGVLYMVFR